ncbi:MAG TPA: galactokinase family protein [Bryobacteraceae bacterium]|nr:galactokinase family protein [Bryobacteraceae bacterium]
MSYSQVISVPGRVNLIGEHIDYHQLPVLPMAIQRRVSLSFETCPEPVVHAASAGYPDRDFPLADGQPFPPGDWGNYLKAAVQMLVPRWPLSRGIKVAISSNLSPAAGLSSSSALITAFALALLETNCIRPTIQELMELLPEGEQYVGTRGGGMDHAAVLASRPGAALLVHFSPFKFEPIPIPPNWAFVVAHSLTVAEKSGATKAEYNARRTSGLAALQKLGLPSFQAAPATPNGTAHLAARERDAFLHVVSETRRVEAAVSALRQNDIQAFGQLLTASHASLRDHLNVSNTALDELVQSALRAGAYGARLTGAGFGGCVIALCKLAYRDQLRDRLITTFYANRPGFQPDQHLIYAEPSAGALSA